MKNPVKKLALALLGLASAWTLSAQTTIKGVVTDESGEPLIGAGVVVEAINLVAQSFCESQMQAGDEVIVTEMEHHSNIVSWQLQDIWRTLFLLLNGKALILMLLR